MSKVTSITPVTLQQLRPKIVKAVQSILDEYGLIVNQNINFSYNPNECTTKLKISIPGSENPAVGKVAETTLKQLGIYNARFREGNKIYKVIDYNARKYKFPVVILNENTNQRVCCTVGFVKNSLPLN